MVERAVERTQYWADPKTRTVVRDGSPALAESLADIEQYLLPMERLRTAALSAWGVAEGLRVSATPGSTDLTVSAGTALDAAGRQIILAPGGAVVTDQNADPTEISNVPTVTTGTDGRTTVPTAGVAAGEYLLSVTWREVLGDNDFVNAQTWLHAPWLHLVPVSGFSDVGAHVVLARVTLAAGGTVADGGLTAGPRRVVGTRTGRLLLQAPRGSAGEPDGPSVDQTPVAELGPGQGGDVVLTLLGQGQPPRTALTVDQGSGTTRVAALSVTGNADVDGALTVAGKITGPGLSVTGAVGAALVEADVVSSRSLSVTGAVAAGDVTAGSLSGETLLVRDITVANVTGAGWLRLGDPGPSLAALVVVDARPDNNWNTAAFQKPGVGPNWSHVHWGATGDWYIRSAAGNGRVILQDSGGRVGVGTDTPQARLDVAGEMALNGRLVLSSDSYLRLNQGNAFGNGVHTPGLFSAGSINIGGHGGWVSPGFARLAVAGGIAAGGAIDAFQYRTDGQSWLRGQVYTGGILGHWDGAADLKLWGSDIWDSGDGVLRVRSGGGRTQLQGEVWVTGALHKQGGGFTIDHPLDPDHKYLSHSFVESPEMVNLYVGSAVTGDDGTVRVQLPDFFQALNRDARIQLTTVGRLTMVTVDGEVTDNAFTIRTDEPGVTVSWQVTGVRQDAWAEDHRIPVEQEKPERQQGRSMHVRAVTRASSNGLPPDPDATPPSAASEQASDEPPARDPLPPPEAAPSSTAPTRTPTPTPYPRGGI